MPRDLFSSEANPQTLVASPESQTPKADSSEASVAEGGGGGGYNQFVIHRGESRDTSRQLMRNYSAKADERKDLHPYVQTLSLSNLESCIALENVVFPEQERCSREKVGPS